MNPEGSLRPSAAGGPIRSGVDSVDDGKLLNRGGAVAFNGH